MKKDVIVLGIHDGHNSGATLVKMGVPQGAAMREMLRLLKVAKLDGEMMSRKEEEQLVLALLAGGMGRRSR